MDDLNLSNLERGYLNSCTNEMKVWLTKVLENRKEYFTRFIEAEQRERQTYLTLNAKIEELRKTKHGKNND